METTFSGLDKPEIQALVFTGYPKSTAGAYLFLRVRDAAQARAWLRTQLAELTFGESSQNADTMNLALTAPGLSALGLDDASLGTFPPEFREGLRVQDDAYRARILGDVGQSAPSRWLWGGPREPVHVLLMLFGAEPGFEARLEAERQRFAGALQELIVVRSASLPDRREHFGFVDGISQSRIQGATARGDGSEPIKAGEFVLGYENEFGQLPGSPSVPAAPPAEKLKQAAAGRADLGHNGTFLVARQLEQDVEGFWRSMGEFSKGPGGRVDAQQAEWLASKCVGRWPSGAPLVRAPDRDDPKWKNDNAFDYRDDVDGLRCPIGAHIRKANPRDSLEPNREASLKATRRRRILRRGRSYGRPLARFETEPQRQERGLLFLCLNTNIRRQFEFIQQSWLNNEKFDGLYEDQDPIVGDQTPGVGSTFTIPMRPLRRRLVGLERFVQVRGGDYFFLPSKSALEYLSRLG